MSDLNTEVASYNLNQAICAIADHFDDPRQVYNKEKGTYELRNDMSWTQRLILQALADKAWSQQYDTRYDKNGKVRGISHKLDQAREYAKNLARRFNGTEFDIEAMNRAADWIERLESELQALDEFYHSVAAVYEFYTGDKHKPYEPWTTSKNAQSQSADSPLADSAALEAAKARFAEIGIDINTDAAYEPQTNGVETTEEDLAENAA